MTLLCSLNRVASLSPGRASVSRTFFLRSFHNSSPYYGRIDRIGMQRDQTGHGPDHVPASRRRARNLHCPGGSLSFDPRYCSSILLLLLAACSCIGENLHRTKKLSEKNKLAASQFIFGRFFHRLQTCFQVHIGGYSQEIGYLKYDQQQEFAVPLGIAVVIVIVVVVVIVAFLVYRYRKRADAQEMQLKKKELQLNEMEASVAKVCREGEEFVFI